MGGKCVFDSFTLTGNKYLWGDPSDYPDDMMRGAVNRLASRFGMRWAWLSSTDKAFDNTYLSLETAGIVNYKRLKINV